MGSSFSTCSDSNNIKRSKKITTNNNDAPYRTMTPVEKGSVGVSTSHVLTMTPTTASTSDSTRTPFSSSSTSKSSRTITISTSTNKRGGNNSCTSGNARRNKLPSIKKRLSYRTARTSSSPVKAIENQNERSSPHQARGEDTNDHHSLAKKAGILSFGKAPSQSQSQSQSISVVTKITSHVSPSTNCKITVINEPLKVFVVDLLTSENGLAICDSIRQLAEDHCHSVEEANMPQLSWRKLYTYTKMDLPCSDVTSLRQPMQEIMRKIKLICGEMFDNIAGCSQLRPRSWKEPHLLKYVSSNEVQHTGIEMHYDGCDITWSLMLTEKNEYDGGGTFVRSLGKTIKIGKGQVLIHPGELYHKGVPITRGMRLLAICFMDGYNPQIYDPTCCTSSKSSTDKSEKNNVSDREKDIIET